jgi:RsiW-degrading membrane proteinase PrsW (M82 family)
MAANGQITDLHLISEDKVNWLPAGKVGGLFINAAAAAPRFTAANDNSAFEAPQFAEGGAPFRQTGPSGAGGFAAAPPNPGIGQFADTDVLAGSLEEDPGADEASRRSTGNTGIVIPLSSHTLSDLLKDKIFWAIAAMGTLPLFITTINHSGVQMTGLLFYFAMLWGWILRAGVLKSGESVKMPIVAFFFTGLVGMYIFFTLIHPSLPQWFRDMPNDSDLWTSLKGFIFCVGYYEEMCKLAPVIIYLSWKRDEASPESAILIGIFSGLGFAAFENLGYAHEAIYRTVEKTRFFGENFGLAGAMEGAADGTKTAMIVVMLRSISTVFAHAVLSGLAASFLVVMIITNRHYILRSVLALSVPAFLHGIYDWLTRVQNTVAAATIFASFLLFYIHIVKLRHEFSQTSGNRQYPGQPVFKRAKYSRMRK